MLKQLIIISIYFVSLFTSGQTTQIICKFNSPNNIDIVFLAENIGGKYSIIDSCKVDEFGQFTFSNNFQTGYYAFWVEPENSAQIIINKEDSIIIEISDTLLRNSIHVKKSRENILLWNFIAKRKKYKSAISQAYINKTAFSEGSIEYNYFNHLEDSLQKVYQKYVLNLTKEDSNTFFAKTIISDIVTSSDEPFFKYVDFTDKELIRSGVFTKKITDYLQLKTEFTEEGFIASVDYILEQAEVNKEVYEFVLTYLINLFDAVGPDVILDYLIEFYVLEGACSDLEFSEIIENQLASYKKLIIGETAPNVSIFNLNGFMQNLHDLCLFNKTNILFFGSNHCGFCKDAIATLNGKNNLKDIQIIYISLDDNIKQLQETAYNKPDNWVFLSEFKSWDSKSAEIFKIHKTPSFYILDSRAKIISKPGSVNELLTDLDFIK